jgi:hypothetical protein
MKHSALPPIKTRSQMENALNTAISGAESEDDSHIEDDLSFSGLDETGLKHRKKRLKSMFIESNIDDLNYSIDEIKLYGYDLINTLSPDIIVLKSRKNGTFSYLDMEDKRFWVLYSLDISADVKTDINKIIQENNSHLDYMWLSSSSLKSLGKDSDRTDFSMSFTNKFNNNNIKLKHFSMRIWSDESTEILDEFSNSEFTKSAACLSNIGVSYRPNEKNFIKANLSTRGFFNVTKASSIDDVTNYKNKVVDYYKQIIEDIENNYRTSYSVSDDGINIKGDICTIKLSRDIKIENVEAFCLSLLKGKDPYRMVGYANKINDDHFLLNVLDLHTYDTLDLEVFEDEILINLPEDSCGNAVTRLFTLCQSTIDPHAQLMGNSHAIIN